MQVKAYAKINLLLRVLYKRTDGYHELQSIMQSVALADLLTFSKLDNNEIRILCDKVEVPRDKNNTVYKAAEIIKKQFKLNFGIEIKINKKIPLGAGLAGGSADAAATLVALNELGALGLTEQQLLSIGGQVGADVPFCLKGGTCLVEGRGEKVSSLKNLALLNILVVVPEINVSTAWVYQQVEKDLKKEKQNFMNNEIDFTTIYNDLEQYTFQKYPEIKEIKAKLAEKGAIKSLMSGSGSAVFGLYDNQNLLEKDYKEFKLKYSNVFKVRPINKGVEILYNK